MSDPADQATPGPEAAPDKADLAALIAADVTRPDATARAHERLAAVTADKAHRIIRQIPLALLCGAVGFGISLAWNTYEMAVRYDGHRVPAGSPVTGSNNTVAGGAFWVLFPLVASAVVTYALRRGPARFRQDLADLPVVVRTLIRVDGDGAAIHLAWGFAGASLVMLFLAPALSGVLAVGALVALAGPLRSVSTAAGLLAWRWAVERIKPSPGPRHPAVAVSVAQLGTIGALAVGLLVASRSSRMLLVLVALGLAAYLTYGRKRPASAGVIVAVLGATAVALKVLDALPALADDGGWSECGRSLSKWILDCPGNGRVWFQGLLGAGAGGTGGLLGGAGGGLLPSGDPEMDRIHKLLDAWRHNHPGETAEDFQRWMVEQGWATAEPGFWDTFWKGVKSDTGRGLMTAGYMGVGFLEAGKDAVVGLAGLVVNTPGLLQGAFDFYTGQSLDETARQLGEFLGKDVPADAAQGFQDWVREFETAVGAGDDRKIAEMIGTPTGKLMFELVSAKAGDAALVKIKGAIGGKGAGLVDEAVEAGGKGGKSKGLLDDAAEEAGKGKGRGITHAEEGTLVTMEDANAFGYTKDQFGKLQEIADEKGLTIKMRPGNPDSVKWLESGEAWGKTENLKMKTINEADTYLGWRPEDKGLAGYGRPKVSMEEAVANAPDHLKVEVEKRWQQRATEADELDSSVTKYSEEGIWYRDEGKSRPMGFEVDQNGVVRDPTSGKGFTGDPDAFHITKADGTALSRAEKADALRALQEGVDMKHGDIYIYEPKDPFVKQIKQAVLDKHSPGGEGLIDFSAGQAPKVTYYTGPK
ncbi:MAG TPA: hypothetical protein VGL92_18120 [Acidimicrobiia bacterium]